MRVSSTRSRGRDHEQDLRSDLTRTVFAILIIGGLIVGSLWILRPFIAATIWAAMIVVTTWPILRVLQSRLWGKRWLAATVMTLALLLVFVVPLSAAIGTIVANASEIVGWASRSPECKIPQPPEFVEKIPIIGEKAAHFGATTRDKGLEEIAEIVRPYASRATSWFVAEVGSFGLVTLQLLLTIVICAILYMTGEDAARWVRRFGRRLAGDRGDDVVLLAGQAIRGVALGVVVTALVQSILGGVGLAVAGVPFAAVLTAVMFMLALAQIGAVPVLVGGTGLAVVAGRHRLVHRAARLDDRRREPRQHPASDADQGGRGSAVASHLRRRDRGLDRIRSGRAVRRAGAPGRRLYAARRMGDGGARHRRPCGHRRGMGAVHVHSRH